jgi:PIN domain nuclease of toxin-antitoxin system
VSRFLLDTHALLWWLAESPALPNSARNLIAHKGNTVMVSAASAWEVATKVRLGKLDIAREIVEEFSDYLERERFESLSVTLRHATRAGLLPGPHQDPFDRMLIAQALEEGLSIVSNERIFDEYGVVRSW